MLKMECTCSQKYHEAPVKTIEVCENAVEKIADILSGYKRIFMVADENTYEVVGKRAEKLLSDAGILSHVCVIDSPGLPTWENVGRVLIECGIDDEVYDINKFSSNCDYILAVGSGSINDICRMVSYRIGVEYGILGTAPSMDGYASVVAPLICGNKKIIYTCSIARHIIIDLNICANAPYDMLLAGIGDMIGKYVYDLHLKDGLYPTDGKSLGREVRFGDGKANFKELLPKLKALGYEGSLTIEREIEGEKQIADIIHARDLIKEYWE